MDYSQWAKHKRHALDLLFKLQLINRLVFQPSAIHPAILSSSDPAYTHFFDFSFGAFRPTLYTMPCQDVPASLHRLGLFYITRALPHSLSMTCIYCTSTPSTPSSISFQLSSGGKRHMPSEIVRISSPAVQLPQRAFILAQGTSLNAIPDTGVHRRLFNRSSPDICCFHLQKGMRTVCDWHEE